MVETEPIDTIEELIAWTPASVDVRLIGTPLNVALGRTRFARRLLVCHDMCGGYLNDRLVVKNLVIDSLSH